ncbi:MAG: VOC family protein, partial [Prolixibacteraceae bacterium]|nr:VOC family protein [Prolixibacteraceae bacterium]
MKNLLVSLLFLIFSFVLAAQTTIAPSEFSNPTISVGVVVADLEKSIDFYTKVIGMAKTGEFSVDGDKSKELGLTDGRSIDVTILKLEDSENSTEWKLMSFGEKANHPKQKYMHDDNGMQYITIFVHHLNPFIER